MNAERKVVLLQLVTAELNEHDWFAYENWDDHIEVSGDMTEKELEWLDDHCDVIVTVKEKL